MSMTPEALLEVLLELAARAALEIRVLAPGAGGGDLRPTGSAACRVGDRVWVVLAPDDPPAHQARVLATALARYRAALLEESYLPPAVREFIEASTRADRAGAGTGGGPGTGFDPPGS